MNKPPMFGTWDEMIVTVPAGQVMEIVSGGMMAKVYHNDIVEWWIGESVDDVIADYAEITGVPYDPGECGEWVQVPDDQIIEIGSEEPWKEMPRDSTIAQKNSFYICSAKAKDWAAIGNGFLCSTEY